jgi:hypothetical protein
MVCDELCLRSLDFTVPLKRAVAVCDRAPSAQALRERSARPGRIELGGPAACLRNGKKLATSYSEAQCDQALGVLGSDLWMQRVADDRVQAGAQLVGQLKVWRPFTHLTVVFFCRVRVLTS